MTKKVLSNEEFWDLVDQYESYRKGNVRDAIEIIVDAYQRHKSKDVDQALSDYELLTCGKPITTFVKNQITTKLLFNETQEKLVMEDGKWKEM